MVSIFSALHSKFHKLKASRKNSTTGAVSNQVIQNHEEKTPTRSASFIQQTSSSSPLLIKSQSSSQLTNGVTNQRSHSNTKYRNSLNLHELKLSNIHQKQEKPSSTSLSSPVLPFTTNDVNSSSTSSVIHAQCNNTNCNNHNNNNRWSVNISDCSSTLSILNSNNSSTISSSLSSSQMSTQRQSSDSVIDLMNTSNNYFIMMNNLNNHNNNLNAFFNNNTPWTLPTVISQPSNVTCQQASVSSQVHSNNDSLSSNSQKNLIHSKDSIMIDHTSSTHLSQISIQNNIETTLHLDPACQGIHFNSTTNQNTKIQQPEDLNHDGTHFKMNHVEFGSEFLSSEKVDENRKGVSFQNKKELNDARDSEVFSMTCTETQAQSSNACSISEKTTSNELNSQNSSLPFHCILSQYSHSTRMSFRGLMIMDFANQLISIMTNHSVHVLEKVQQFLRIQVKPHGRALYEHVNGGRTLIHEVLNYAGSERAQRKYLPLHCACSIGNLNLVKYLLRQGANRYLRRFGELPEESARQQGHFHIVLFLRIFSQNCVKIERNFRYLQKRYQVGEPSCLTDLVIRAQH